MKDTLIDVTEETALILQDVYRQEGDHVEFEIQLPEAILLDSFVINGVVTRCEYFRNNGSSGYLTRLAIGTLPEENRKILAAYVAYIDQQRELDEIRIDYQALEETIRKFGENFLKILSLAERLNRHAVKWTTCH